jgi:hypothetical protein
MNRALLLLALAAGTGCAETSFTGGFAPEDALTDAEARLRVDVYPPVDLDLRDARGGLLTLRPQTFQVDAEPEVPADVTLTPAFGLTGLIEGAALTPWMTQDLPTVTGPLVDAEVGFDVPGTIQRPRARTDADGLYDLLVVPSDQEQVLSIVPATPGVPAVERRVVLDGERRTLDVAIPVGAPVWGFATDWRGTPLAGATVRAISPSGLTGAPARTDETGRFLLTVEPGAAYTLVSEGRGPLDPTVRVATGVIDDVGARVDVSFGELGPLGTITGTVRGPGGQRVGSDAVRVRITSTALRSAPDTEGAYVREIGTDDGIFSAVVPPGTFRIEVYSALLDGPAPLVVDDVEVSGQLVDVGALMLRALATRFAEVVDPAGEPVAGAVVACTEQGFGGRTFTAIADPIGQLILPSPEVPMACTASPPAGRLDLATTRVPLDAEAIEVDLAAPWRFEMVEGALVVGTVRARLDTRLDTDRIRPLPGAVVEVRDGAGRLLGVGVSGPDGAFRLRVAR